MNVHLLDIETVQAAFQESERQQTFWEQHWEEFRQRYPDRFVAVADGKVVSTRKNLDGLSKALRLQGLDARNVWVRFVWAESPNWAL
ncbi:MAG: hypothetical protein ACR2PL_23240 [Dehalococcoidia bacterium]